MNHIQLDKDSMTVLNYLFENGKSIGARKLNRKLGCMDWNTFMQKYLQLKEYGLINVSLYEGDNKSFEISISSSGEKLVMLLRNVEEEYKNGRTNKRC